ncbi:MAG: GNAT family N-acetyltransferase [Lachnospiraceae bacterium]|nr:GNAT family N-acetyltransferase [Lachnospiraceae bacterium]
MALIGEAHKENKKEYEIRVLTRSEIQKIYARNMTGDFPPDELKPLSMMEMALDKGKYICYGYFRGGEMAAYAYFALLDRNILIDYYAVDSNLRGQGLGSAFLADLIAGPLNNYDCALLEVEDPDYAADPEEKETCLSRLRFYLRNGLTDTGARSLLNHVNYAILALPVGKASSGKEVLNIYLSIYEAMPRPADFPKDFQIEGWELKRK